MGVIKKCTSFRKLKEFKEKEMYTYFKTVEGNDGPIVQMEGQEVIMAGSNNYLGLSTHPEVKQASINAIKKYGTTNSGSRFMNGTLDIHEELEVKLAEFLNKEAVITFTTGFQANQGVVVPLIGKNEFIISDKENHNSILQGTLITKAMYGKKILIRYHHDDMSHLNKILAKIPLQSGKLIVTDGVFSMSGKIANLPSIVSLAKKYNANILIDEAHAIGVIGDNGKGTGSLFNLNHEVDLITGTFSKSFGSIGGFVAGKQEVIDYIKHTSPALMFSASIAPPQAAAALKALEIIKENPQFIHRLNTNSTFLRNEIKRLGYHILDGETPIIPIVFGDDEITCKVWRELMNMGVYTNCILNPAVPDGLQLIRLSVMATHERDHLEAIVYAFKRVKEKLEAFASKEELLI